MITQNYKIDMTPGAVPLRVKVSQYDVGVRQLVFQLFNGATALTSSSFDLLAQIVGTKPDKKGFEYSATVNATSSAIYVTVDITEQMTACAGDVVCEIRMYDNSNRISSANFILDVEQAALGADTDISETELPDIIDEARSYAAAAEDAAERAEQAAAGAVAGLELGKMTSFSDGVIVTDIDLHRAPVAGDRILFYHNAAVASPSSLTTYNDGVAVTTTIGDFSLTHPAGLTLMKCVALGESLRWQTVQDIADGGYTAGTGISINGTTINNSAPQLGDDIAYSRIDTVTSGALGYFSADADCLVMDFRTDAEPYNGGYTLRLTTTGASFKYAVLKDKAGNDYTAEIPSGSLVLCKSNVSGTGSESDPVVVTVLEISNTEMAHDIEVLKDICITEKTVSGNPITLTDALPYNAVSLSTEIEASQDLHGYDHPWVGGAGKNLLPMTVSGIKALNAEGTWSGNVYTNRGVTFTVLTDNDDNVIGIKTNGAPINGNIQFNLCSNFKAVSGTTYTINGSPSGVSDSTFRIFPSSQIAFPAGNRLSDDVVADRTRTAAGNEDVTFFINIFNGVNVDDKVFYPQIEIGAQATAFAPYSNICPISGRTEMSVDTVGRNVWDEQWEQGAYSYASTGGKNTSPNYIRNANQIPVLPDTDYYVKRPSSGEMRVGFYAKDGSYLSSFTNISGSGSTIRTPSNAYNITFDYTSATTYNNDICINVSDPTFNGQYVPYAGCHTITVQLGQTVYGGTLNVTTGELTLTYANIATYNGETIGEPWISSMDEYTQGGTPTTGAQVVYPLATPTTIQLTPEQLTMLKDYNRLSSDGGGDLSITYKADRLAAIEAALAELQ